MSHTLTVALLGVTDHAFDEVTKAIPPEAWSLPYADRQKAEIEAADDEPLIEVLLRAAEKLGCPTSTPWGGVPRDAVSFVAFYKPADDDGFRSDRPLEHTVTLVDHEGRARWGTYFKDATVGELIAAGKASALNGDPLRPYLIPSPSQGDGGSFISFAALLSGLGVLWKVLDAASTAEGALSLTKQANELARNRVGKGRPALEARVTDWQDRGARPEHIRFFLRQRNWATQDLAELLGCTAEEAEAIMWALGFTQAESGLWRPGGDDSADFLLSAVDDLALSFTLEPSSFERLARDRTEAIVRGGAPPPFEEPDHDLGDDDEEAWTVDLGIRLECICGQPDCVAVVRLHRYFPANNEEATQLRWEFEEVTDHFHVDFRMVGLILGALADIYSS